MKRFIAKGVALIMMLSLIIPLSACGGNKRKADEISADYEWATEENINGTKVMDSSEISDYEGSNIFDLIAWNTSGTGNYKVYQSSDDVVYPEIKRITGLSIDTEKSFDNKGSLPDVRFANLYSTGKVPDIAYGQDWLDKEEVYDLTDYIDTYCPTIKARMPSFVWNNENVNGGEKGKVYGIPTTLGSISLTSIDPLADPDKSIMFSYANESCPYIYVREDILQDAYPNAKSQADIDNMFAEKGHFTEEDLFDVPINSAHQFRTEFLPKIYDAIRNTKENGAYKYQISPTRWVEPMLVTAGSDNDTWDFLGKLVPGLTGSGGNSANSNFSYWDTSTQRIESMLYQDFYKQEIYEWAKMIDEGKYVSRTGMTTLHATLASELNSGYYAIGYLSSSMNTSSVCNWKGKTVNYRKVYLNIPVDSDRYEFMGSGEAAVSSVKIFKDSIDESEIPQLLRWLDFQCSRTADMLYAWGPDGDNALFTTDEDGNRRYKDEELAYNMVYSTAMLGSNVQRYNLSNGSVASPNVVFGLVYNAGSIYHPKCTYDISSMKGLASSYFSSWAVLSEKTKTFVGLKKVPGIQQWNNSVLDGIETTWGKRELIEDKLKQLLISGASQSVYNNAWNDLQSTLQKNGWTKSYFNGAVTNAFLKVNSDYLDKFYKGN